MANQTVKPARPTERFSKTLGGSIKSLVGEKGRKYFILEHKTSSEKHKSGETTEFIGDYVELGRGNKYAVNFGEDCSTVSRPHAAIIRNDAGWTIRHLSARNPTIVNRNVITNDVQLRNGDEIQLSYEGPKMLFLTPSNNLVSTMGFTTRIKAVANEAVKPYKTAFAITIVVFVLIIAGLVTFIGKQQMDFDNMRKEMADAKVSTRHEIDSLNAAHLKDKKFLQQQIKLAKTQGSGSSFQNEKGFVASTQAAPGSIKETYPSIYFIQTEKVVCEIDGSPVNTDEYGISGTGFLLSDGRFVTARHVVKPWLFINEESKKQELAMNLVASNGGKVIHYFTAVSPTGQKLSFTSEQFTMDASADVFKTITGDDGKDYVLTFAGAGENGNDWASANAGGAGLSFNSSMSNSLQVSTPLYVLGYPWGTNKVTYSESTVSVDGLNNGLIDISGRNFDHGNSGGPVFAKQDDKYYVVGIVSAAQGQQGFIVPISAVK